MNYELFKKLKDAGFPQNKHGTGIWIDEETKQSSPSIWLSSRRDMDLDKCIYVPTLEELIEACGEKLRLLAPDTFLGKINRWIAYESIDENYYPSGRKGTGSTPLEAVVNLYLALQSVIIT